ncbi:cytochrome c-type biogenesis protein [Mesorhizobium soli]|uniref:cytochrome c biogenesis CcdA family protein n=1 Tax=Pseudaminobacter soli (ex Li et al. 2025) TaxID=1295366 RepID=UPI00247644A7|nr:cytochrome c biogenesis CcdA family protein [Mesorhizobium soli]MDH6230760.1 cytochrome c-type biogenesis protein [Mesorhizobium soli]
MEVGSIALAFLAGVLSTLSPCVLPLLPLLLGAAVSAHRFGPFALASGLASSFVAIGLFVATIGFSIGLDSGLFRIVAAVLLVAFGAVLMAPRLQAQLAVAAGPVGGWTGRRFGDFAATGLRGQFAVGLLLGAVWSPCVGPTLGAASLLAAQGKDLWHVAAVMITFGIGAALPLLALGVLSREVVMRWRDRLHRAGQGGKTILGAILFAIGLLVLSGADKRLESFLVDVSPTWLTQLTTRL